MVWLKAHGQAKLDINLGASNSSHATWLTMALYSYVLSVRTFFSPLSLDSLAGEKMDF